MSDFEVPEPILNSPFEEPQAHWHLEEGVPPERRAGRRPAGYFYRDPNAALDADEHAARGAWQPLPLVNLLRERVGIWRGLALRGEGGVTRMTAELLNYWRREGREKPLFFAQLEAAETIIFLNEARHDLLQGIDVPPDAPDLGAHFTRYALKMATGSGKTTVMAMLAAWSILNKVNERGNSRYSDVVLVVCPNVTIRSRLNEINPELGEASLYRTRDLVPAHLMPDLAKGRVLVTNWHVFEPKSASTGGESGRVLRIGERVQKPETIRIGEKSTTARGWRYLTQRDFDLQVASGQLQVVPNTEEHDGLGNLQKVQVISTSYRESDKALVQRVLGRATGRKQNLLVFNDEAHHAYRLQPSDESESSTYAEDFLTELFGGEEEVENFKKEATVWVEGLDKVHAQRGINFCVDLSATPYYLGRMGNQTNRIFPWTVSDFGLTDAIESGLVKIPQLAVRDTTGAEVPGYFNVWRWIMTKLTAAERGGNRGNPKPEAILKWAHTPIVMLAGLWEQLRLEWAENREDPRPPVFILVCKNTRIAKIIYDWLAEEQPPLGIPSAGIEGFRNQGGHIYTIRVDSKVVAETDSDNAKNDDGRWMRLTLDTVGKTGWPLDRMGNPIYPEGFEALAQKLNRPLTPPGRDIRCIISVGMLTEGWDCNTVTHIVGLRPFMSQLLCEQVVGRGLRRASYELNAEGKLSEEVAKIFGVPFEIIPFKATTGPKPPPEKRHHVVAVPQKAQYEIKYPRLQGYRSAIRNRVMVNWDEIAPLKLDPLNIPPEVQMKAALPTNNGRPSLSGPGRLEDVNLNPYRTHRRFQELAFDLAKDLTREFSSQQPAQVPAHVLFPQLLRMVEHYLKNKVEVIRPNKIVDVFLSPYYGWVIENLREAIRPDTTLGEAPEVPIYEKSRGPGSTAEVNFWTSRDVREVIHSHLNFVVADTRQWEQSTAYILDTYPGVRAFVKNAGLGFAIPYFHNSQPHDYIPDFIVAFKDAPNHFLILETKGYDENAAVKVNAAERWVKAVNADGAYGTWEYAIAFSVDEARQKLDEVCDKLGTFIQIKIKTNGEYRQFNIAQQHLLISNLALLLGVDEYEFDVMEVLPGSTIYRLRNRSVLGNLLQWLMQIQSAVMGWLGIEEITYDPSIEMNQPSYGAQLEQNDRLINLYRQPAGVFAQQETSELKRLEKESSLRNKQTTELQETLLPFVNLLADALLNCATMKTTEGRNQVVAALPTEIRNNIKLGNTPKYDAVNISRTCLNYPDGPRKLQIALRYFEADSFDMQGIDKIIGSIEQIIENKLIDILHQ